jgi:hypothetical protein
MIIYKLSIDMEKVNVWHYLYDDSKVDFLFSNRSKARRRLTSEVNKFVKHISKKRDIRYSS